MARVLSRAAPWRIGIAVAAVAGAVTLGGPAAVGALSGGGGQPPPGAPNIPTDVQPAPDTQPPAGAPNVPTNVQPAPDTQPVNTHPQKPGPPTQLENDEPNARPHLHQVDNGTALSGPDQGD
jgi:hypothetical protein